MMEVRHGISIAIEMSYYRIQEFRTKKPRDSREKCYV